MWMTPLVTMYLINCLQRIPNMESPLFLSYILMQLVRLHRPMVSVPQETLPASQPLAKKTFQDFGSFNFGKMAKVFRQFYVVGGGWDGEWCSTIHFRAPPPP